MERTAVNRRIRAWLGSFFAEHLPNIFEGWDPSAISDIMDAIGKNIENLAYHSKAPDGLTVNDKEYERLRGSYRSTEELARALEGSLKEGFRGAESKDLTLGVSLAELENSSRKRVLEMSAGGTDPMQSREIGDPAQPGHLLKDRETGEYKREKLITRDRELRRVRFQRSQALKGEKQKPLLVMRVQDKYRIIEGFHRLEAARYAALQGGRDSFIVPALVVDPRGLVQKMAWAIVGFLNKGVTKKSSITLSLDRIALILESRGMRSHANTLDIVANTIESLSPRHTIYVDMDGVLCDFVRQYKDRTGEDLSLTDNWDPDSEVLLDESFWSEMHWMPDGRELWNFVKRHKPTILSSPGKEGAASIPGKHAWLLKHLGQVPSIMEQ